METRLHLLVVTSSARLLSGESRPARGVEPEEEARQPEYEGRARASDIRVPTPLLAFFPHLAIRAS